MTIYAWRLMLKLQYFAGHQGQLGEGHCSLKRLHLWLKQKTFNLRQFVSSWRNCSWSPKIRHSCHYLHHLQWWWIELSSTADVLLFNKDYSLRRTLQIWTPRMPRSRSRSQSGGGRRSLSPPTRGRSRSRWEYFWVSWCEVNVIFLHALCGEAFCLEILSDMKFWMIELKEPSWRGQEEC